MTLCAKDGVCLGHCVLIARSACQRAERDCPRTGPGRKPEVSDWVVATMIVVAILHRKKSRLAQFAFWQARAEAFQAWFPKERMLARSQFYERARRVTALLGLAMKHLGTQAVRRGWADVQIVALDKSLIAARGRKRHSPERRLRRGVDPDATWSYSEHDRWVFGYCYEVAVSAGKSGVVWPLLASFHTANCSEQKSCLAKLPQLPRQTRYVLADAGYDSNAVGESVEWTVDGQSTRRRFLCPEIPRPQVGKPRRPGSRETRIRQWHRRLRDARRKFTRSSQGRKLYRRRNVTVEPFHSRFKQIFDLNDRVWHWGLENNRVTVLAAFVCLSGFAHLQSSNPASSCQSSTPTPPLVNYRNLSRQAVGMAPGGLLISYRNAHFKRAGGPIGNSLDRKVEVVRIAFRFRGPADRQGCVPNGATKNRAGPSDLRGKILQPRTTI
jgi:Transposase DDE domain